MVSLINANHLQIIITCVSIYVSQSVCVCALHLPLRPCRINWNGTPTPMKSWSYANTHTHHNDVLRAMAMSCELKLPFSQSLLTICLLLTITSWHKFMIDRDAMTKKMLMRFCKRHKVDEAEAIFNSQRLWIRI